MVLMVQGDGPDGLGDLIGSELSIFCLASAVDRMMEESACPIVHHEIHDRLAAGIGPSVKRNRHIHVRCFDVELRIHLSRQVLEFVV